MSAQPWPGLSSLVSPASFERVLARRPVAKSAHFSLHYAAATAELSTADMVNSDKLVESQSGTARPGWRLGLVVPKRHARRAVTRNLVKRQARAVMHDCLDRLPAGDWVVRLRSPFQREQFASAASEPLKRAVRSELCRLFEHALASAAR